ncbi:MAG: hypothetical protein AB4372_22635 [Xenococcus sp. (in: cyanobacteria)]
MSNNLEQRIQQRLIEPAGVINTQQLHCHYQATQGMAGRLIQRMALPEQVKFRYGSGVLQPRAMLHNLQRQRRESANDFAGQDGDYTWSIYHIASSPQLPASPVSGASVQRSMQNQSRQFNNSGESEKSHNIQQSIIQKATGVTKPLGEPKPKSKIALRSLGQTNRDIGEPASSGEPHQKLRINRQAAISEVNALSSNKFHSEPGQVDIHVNSHPPVIQTQLETSGAFPASSPESPQLLRISRQARIATVHDQHPLTRREGESTSPKSQDLPLTKATNQLSASTAQTKADASDAVIPAKIQANKSPLEMIESQKAVNLNQSGNSQIGVPAKSSQQPHQDLPLAQATSQLSATVQRKADTSLNSNSLGTEVGSTNQPKTKTPVIKGTIQNKAAEAKYQTTFSTRSIDAVIPHDQSLSLVLPGQQANLPVQLSPETAITVNPIGGDPKPSKSSNSSELPQVWLKSINELPTSEELSTTTIYSQKMPLPLAKVPISMNKAIANRAPEGQIARQTNVVSNSTVQLAMQGNYTTPMSFTETASASPIDINKIAEQVSRILARQLAVEQERRGIEKWH